MSLIKALVIITLILLCFIISLGGGPNGVRTGFYFWQNPGGFGEYSVTVSGTLHVVPGNVGRFLGVWACIVQATFAYLGTELVGVAFGETPDPRKNVPRAVNQTLLRIVFFYVAGVLVLGMAVPYNSLELANATKKGTSGCTSPVFLGLAHHPSLPPPLLPQPTSETPTPL
jgi:amino acid transporter